MLRKLAKQHVGDDEAEDRVAKELQRLVVDNAAARILVDARAVGQRVLEQAAIAEAIADDALERLELRAKRHDAAADNLVAMALDDLVRAFGFVVAHRQAKLVRRERERRAREVRRDQDVDAVGFEQSLDDVSLDL